jgi:aryl sulfotransferase
MPRKVREIQNALCDSTRWNGFQFRDDDIVIATYSKSGTTWTQQIVGELVFRGAEPAVFGSGISPWLDARFMPQEQVFALLDAQQHRRFIKTHLPLTALEFQPQVKYICIGRDGRDTAWSLYNHHAGFTDQAYEMFNAIPGRVGPPLAKPPADIVEYFREWMHGGGLPLGETFWQHNQGWWDIRHLPNVLLVHFNHLKTDLPGQMRRIARFLDISIEEELWPTLVEHCSIDYMRQLSSADSQMMDVIFQQGASTFFYKGTNGRWRDVLTAEDIRRYEELADANMSPGCAHWLATGEMLD